MIPIRDNIPSRSVPVVNYLIILTCVLVFFVQLAAEGRHPGRRGVDLVEQFGMIPQRVLHPSRRIVVLEERPVQTWFGVQMATVERRLPPPLINPWWTMLTCIFLHGGWLHIIGNMWFLFIFGDNVEDRFGHFKYLLFYLLCGLAGSFAHLVTNAGSTLPTVGASGAIAGVMGSYFILYPRARVLTLIPIFFFLYPAEIPAPLFLGVWFVLQFLQGLTPVTAAETGGVAWWAHIGGFATGIVLTLSLLRSRTARPPVDRTITIERGRAWPRRI